MLFSCENDLYENKIYQSKINVEKVSLKKSKSNTKINANLFKAISKINSKNKNTTGKIVFDSINNIYFDDEKGIKISKDDYESYTFKIIKENGKLENLLFTKNQYNEFEAFKVKYDFTEEEMKYLNHQDIKPKEVISLSDSTNTTRMIYVTFLVSACSGIPWDCGGSVCGFFEVTFSMWIDENGVSSVSGDNGNAGIGSSGGGGGSSPVVITLPVVNDPIIDKLNSMTKGLTVGSKMLDLTNRITDNKEHGYEFTTDANNRLVSSPLIVGDTRGVHFPPVQINTKVRTHCHYTGSSTVAPDGLDATPSFEDVLGLLSWQNELLQLGATDNDASDITSFIVSRAGAYALRVSNLVKAQQFLADYNNPNLIVRGYTYKDFINMQFDNIAVNANNDCNNCSDAQYTALLEKYFLNFLKKIDAGITIYYSMPFTPNSQFYEWYSF